MKLLFLGADELTRDPRVRRAVKHAVDVGLTAVGACLAGDPPVELNGIAIARYGSPLTTSVFPLRRRTTSWLVREVRGLLRLVRWAARTAGLLGAARAFTDIDVVHANDLETLPAGALISRRRRARLVYDSHEIAVDQDPATPLLFRVVAGFIERRLARNVDAVVTVSEPIADELERRLRLKRRPIVVLNAPERTPIEDKVPSRLLGVIYQGASGPGRHLSDLFDAAECIQSRTQLFIRVAHADLDALRSEATRRGITHRVSVLEPVPPPEMVHALAGFDVGLIINRPVSRNDELVFPNKLFEYLMAGLAVIAPALPGVEPFILGEGVGAVFRPGDAEDLAAVIDRLATDRVLLGAMQRRARDAATDRYNAEAQGRHLDAAWGVG